MPEKSDRLVDNIAPCHQSERFLTIANDEFSKSGEHGKWALRHSRDFFDAEPFQDLEKQKIKYLGIDRSNAYRASAIQQLPHILGCYDAYHLVSIMNEVLDRIHRSIMKKTSYGVE